MEKRPYTGPTDIKVVDGGFHVEGYPDAAHVVALETKKARHLLRLRTHQSALMFCEKAMQELVSLPEGRAIAREALLVGVAVKFFSCFGENKVIGPLSAKRVFAGRTDAFDCFRYWKDIRDKHMAHDESALTIPATCLVLGAAGDVQDVMSMHAVGGITDQTHIELLGNLVGFTLRHVEAEVDRVLPTIFDEAKAMTPDERLALRRITFAPPHTTDVTRRRGS